MKPNDVKEALERFLNSSSPELTRLLVRYWKDQQTVFTFKEIREAIQAGVISKKSVEEWQQDYSKLVHDKIAPEMVKAMKAGAKNVIMVIAIVMLLGGFPLIVFATSGNTEVAGQRNRHWI